MFVVSSGVRRTTQDRGWDAWGVGKPGGWAGSAISGPRRAGVGAGGRI